MQDPAIDPLWSGDPFQLVHSTKMIQLGAFIIDLDIDGDTLHLLDPSQLTLDVSKCEKKSVGKKTVFCNLRKDLLGKDLGFGLFHHVYVIHCQI